MKQVKIESRMVLGILVILAGIVMLLNGLDIIDADISIGTFWPVILIVFGITSIINYDGSTFFGVILTLIGAYFLLKNLGVDFIESINFTEIFWPLIIVLFGVSLLMPRKKG